MSSSNKQFKKIDESLGIYYLDCGRTDYYDDNGIGKFMKYVNDNKYDENDIEYELGDDILPQNCAYIAIDNDFPLLSRETHDEFKYSRNYEIFYTIKCCYKYRKPPHHLINPYIKSSETISEACFPSEEMIFRILSDTAEECDFYFMGI